MLGGKTLFKTAGIIAIITVLSKAIGFIRDLVIAKYYGATLVSDAYFYAYQIPALAIILLGGLGGPFHTATIAVFSKAISDITKKPEESVKKALYSFISITGLLFLVLSILIFFFSTQIISAIASAAPSELITLAALQLKIMSPIMFIGGIIGIIYGISNVYGEFTLTSLSPVIASISVIIAILLFPNDNLGIVLAWGTLVGAIGQLLIQLPVFIKAGFFYSPTFDIKNENVLKVGEILFPAMIATTVGQINIYVDMFFTSRLQEGAWSAIGYANRIFQFPVGIIITALLVPLFPMFSNFVREKDWTSLQKYFHKGLQSLWFMAFPIFALILLFAQDAVALLFQRGKFDANDTLMVTEALVFLSISIIPYVARDTVTRMFYAFDDSKTPFYVATASIIVKVLMNFLLVPILGIGGVTLSTTVVTFFNFIILTTFIRKKINLEFKKFISPVSKILLSTLIMYIAGMVAKNYFLPNEPVTFISGLTNISIGVLFCLATYFMASIALKIEMAIMFLQRITNILNKN